MYCVIDAGALFELLLRGLRAGAVERAVDGRDLVAPAVIDAEIMAALRGLERSHSLSAARAGAALEDLRRSPVRRFPLAPLLDRAWSFRDKLTAYEALYVALAIDLDCPLVTTDDRIPSPRLPATVIIA
ncbi:MAG TPA: type II toxin-antitoxin system VapC family toxin [Mycobacteriales bacterium]|nr:type II toxin-antitoxin system VapC family toxin [Mycobacteriales bacterium]